ncbi:MAG: hypothetical protein L3J07_00165 [Candidatus Magasanikbacteria bacterium]|nr:hypothetical protein [Candidatus Magasanikbacteria bacterium]
MFKEKSGIILFVLLSAFIIGGIFILFNVFQDVEEWGSEEVDSVVVVETEKNDEEEKPKEDIIEIVTSTIENIEVVEKEIIVEKIVEKVVYIEKEVEKKIEKPIEKNLKPVVKAELAVCSDDMRFQCWDLLTCEENGEGYGSPTLWTANNLEEVAPACGQWTTDSAKLPTSWSCCCGYSEDWQEEGGSKACYSPVYTSNLTFE